MMTSERIFGYRTEATKPDPEILRLTPGAVSSILVCRHGPTDAGRDFPYSYHAELQEDRIVRVRLTNDQFVRQELPDGSVEVRVEIRLPGAYCPETAHELVVWRDGSAQADENEPFRRIFVLVSKAGTSGRLADAMVR